jgi:glycerophosphoryl diester phosphodiesterase
MLNDVFTSYREAARLVLPFLATHLFVRVLAFAVLVPVIGLLVGLSLGFSDQSALTDQDIARFLFTPAGAIGTAVVLSLLIAGLILDVAVMTATLRSRQRRPLQALAAGVSFTLSCLPRLVVFSGLLLGRVLMLALPFVLFSAAIYLLMLREFDINYYLTARPPEFRVAGALIGVTLAGLAVLLVTRATGWAVALHLTLFERTSPLASFGQSRALMTGHRAAILSRGAVWLVVRIAVGAAVGAAAAFVIAIIPSLLGGSLRGVAAAILATLIVWSIINAIVAAIANGALADILNDEFDRALEGRPAANDPAPARDADGRPAYRVGTALAVIAVAGVVAVVLTDQFLDQIGTDDAVEVIGHRGAGGTRPENTMAAVRKAIEDGADWIEIDVQETADDQIVVVHDSDFMKSAGVATKVWDATMEDIAAIDIGSSFDPAYADARAPLLRDVLEAAKGRANVIIELKYYGHDVDLENRVIAIVEDMDMADSIATMSLKYPAVQKMRELRPDWRTGVLAATSVGDLSGLEGDFIAVSGGSVSRRLLDRAEAAGKDVYVWTINDAPGMSRMISMGVDGLITDYPDLARDVIAQRAAMSTPERLVLWLSDRFGVLLDPWDAEEVAQ